MMKAKLTPNLISFFLVRRGSWLLKVSVFKHKQIMVIAQNVYEQDRTIVQVFPNETLAANFIEFLVSEDV
jgi:hypothetical protein